MFLTNHCLHLKAGSIPSVQPEQLQELGDPQLQEREHCGQQQTEVWKAGSQRGHQRGLPHLGGLCQHGLPEDEHGHRQILTGCGVR